jgi:nicotinate-nucleotide adenylyltransferase
MARIGIYSGTFDPVHSGHISFALQAVKAGSLDKIYFLPERRPRGKQNVEHFGHRVAMLKNATKPHPQFDVLEMVEPAFSVKRTLRALKLQFEDDQLVFMFGSDLVAGVESWPNSDQLLKEGELIIGLRNDDERDTIKGVIATWKIQPASIVVFNSHAPHISSGKIRNAIRKQKPAQGLLSSVERYSGRNWLYVSIP